MYVLIVSSDAGRGDKISVSPKCSFFPKVTFKHLRKVLPYSDSRFLLKFSDCLRGIDLRRSIH